MKRRAFLANSVRASVGIGALSAPALAQGAREIQMVTTWTPDFPGLGSGAWRIADRITKTSGGRLSVRLFSSDELVPALESFDAVSRGDVQMYHGAEYYWQDKHRAFNFFTGVPLGLTAKEMNAWIAFGGGQELWDELSGEFGVKPLMAGNSGVQMGGWFKDPITSADDLKALRIRISGLGGDVLAALGAEPMALPDTQVVAALEGGIIDAAEWIGPYADQSVGLQQILKTYMYPGFHEPGMMAALGINLAWWNALPEADRLLITACAEAENDMMLAEYNANNGEAMRTMTRNDGVVIARYPDDLWNEIARIGDQVVADVAAADRQGARIYAGYKRFRRAIAGWSEISDQAFLRARADALANG